MTTTHRRAAAATRTRGLGLESYIKHIRNHAVLSRDEEHALATRYREHGDEAAMMTLVRANLRLVIKIVNTYRPRRHQVPDLVQEGNLGLMRAVQKFDPTRGVRLSSYAQWWIRAYVLRFMMDNYRMVRIGTTQNQRKLYYNLNKVRDEFLQRGVEPTVKALAQRLKVRERDVVDMSQRMRQTDVPLSAPVDSNPGIEFGDLLPAEEPAPDDVVAAEQLNHMFAHVLDQYEQQLSGRDAYIWTARMRSDEPQTLRELAQHFGVSRERIRQIEARLMRDLRRLVEAQGVLTP